MITVHSIEHNLQLLYGQIIDYKQFFSRDWCAHGMVIIYERNTVVILDPFESLNGKKMLEK